MDEHMDEVHTNPDADMPVPGTGLDDMGSHVGGGMMGGGGGMMGW
jgi:hypothetical protein